MSSYLFVNWPTASLSPSDGPGMWQSALREDRLKRTWSIPACRELRSVRRGSKPCSFMWSEDPLCHVKGDPESLSLLKLAQPVAGPLSLSGLSSYSELPSCIPESYQPEFQNSSGILLCDSQLCCEQKVPGFFQRRPPWLSPGCVRAGAQGASVCVRAPKHREAAGVSAGTLGP